MEAAVTAFAERGFHATTTRDIASAAGMSPAALYVHHRSKEELLYLISRDGHQKTLDLVRESLTQDGTPTERLATMMRRFAEQHANGHTTARVVNFELAALDPEHLAEVMAMRHEMDTLVRGVIEDGVAGGEFHVESPRLAAAAVLSLGIDVSRWYHEGGPGKPDEISAGYAEFALRIVGA